MIDSDPFLLQSPTQSANSPPPEMAPPEHRHRSLDDTIEHRIGKFSRTQLIQSTILSLAWFFDAQQVFIAVFTDAVPKWSCNNSAAYIHRQSSCNATANLCRLPKDSWSWQVPEHVSIISEWSLECSGYIITGLPSSSFFLGCLLGGFALATLGDSWLGRKNLLALSCLLMSVTGALTTASTNVWMYAGLRFFSGFGRIPIGSCALVLSTELVGKKWRASVGIIGFVCYSLGFLSLPIIAFLLKSHSWRFLYLCTSLPCVVYSFIVYVSLHESPRWLFIQGRKEEFAKAITSLASSSPPESEICNLIEISMDNLLESEEANSKELNIHSAVTVLVRKRWALRRLLEMAAAAFSMGMTYYGMPLGVGIFSSNLYLSVALNAVSEFLASLSTFFVIEKLNRKESVIGLGLASGVCSMASVAMERKTAVGLQIGLELAAFFCGVTAANVFMIYVLELFPTCMRNFAVAMARQVFVLSGVVSPVLVAAGRENGWYSYGVFGATLMVCTVFVWWLPETRGTTLSDTMEEEEFKFMESRHKQQEKR